MTKLLSN